MKLHFGLTSEQQRAWTIGTVYQRWNFMSLNVSLNHDEAVADFQGYFGFSFNADDLAEFKQKFGGRNQAWSLAQALYDFAHRKGYIE